MIWANFGLPNQEIASICLHRVGFLSCGHVSFFSFLFAVWAFWGGWWGEVRRGIVVLIGIYCCGDGGIRVSLFWVMLPGGPAEPRSTAGDAVWYALRCFGRPGLLRVPGVFPIVTCGVSGGIADFCCGWISLGACAGLVCGNL